MCTPHEKVFKSAPVNKRLAIIGCKAYVDQDSAVRKGKPPVRDLDGFYVGIKEQLYIIYIPNINSLINTKIASLNKGMLPSKRVGPKEQGHESTPSLGLNDLYASSEDCAHSES